MLGEPAYFLLLVLVAMFLPGFAHGWAGCAWAYGPAAGLVAHMRLDPLGECPHIVLKQRSQ